MTESEKLLKSILNNWGFNCDKIPESRKSCEKRADYLIQDESDIYLCEVKERLDDSNDLKKFHEELKRGGIVERLAKIDVTSTIKKRIKKADAQLSETPSSAESFKLVWYHATGENINLKIQQLLATIYGRHPIIDLDDIQMLYCYYVAFSAFFDFKEIVAIVWSNKDEGQLCLNTLSPRCEDFKNTKLYKCFKKMNGVLDPNEEEKRGNAYIANCNISRQDEKAVLKYLSDKYGKKFAGIMRMNQISGTMLLPKNKDSGHTRNG